MILFETTTSIFEILWDIALLIFITRLGFSYFLLSYLSSLIIQAAYLNLSSLPTKTLSYFAQPQTEILTLLTSWLLLSALFAKCLIIWYEIPRVKGFRLAIGGVAGLFLVLAEILGALVEWEFGWRVWIWEADLKDKILGGGALLILVLIPWLLMALEWKEGESEEVEEEEEILHGTKKEGVVDTGSVSLLASHEKREAPKKRV